MCKSQGYRPTNATRGEVEALRVELSSLRAHEWQRARLIMREIIEILGYKGGPMGGLISPRACSYCNYFGHTKQWCERKKADDERETERIVRQHQREMSMKIGACKDLQWEKRRQELMARYEAACDAGHGCVAGTDYPCDECEGCKAWDEFMVHYDLQHGTGVQRTGA